MVKPREFHLTAAKRVLRYIKGTICHGVLKLRHENTSMNALEFGYSDSNFSGDQNDKKSTAGYLFMIGDAQISWSSRK